MLPAASAAPPRSDLGDPPVTHEFGRPTSSHDNRVSDA